LCFFFDCLHCTCFLVTAALLGVFGRAVWVVSALQAFEAAFVACGIAGVVFIFNGDSHNLDPQALYCVETRRDSRSLCLLQLSVMY